MNSEEVVQIMIFLIISRNFCMCGDSKSMVTPELTEEYCFNIVLDRKKSGKLMNSLAISGDKVISKVNDDQEPKNMEQSFDLLFPERSGNSTEISNYSEIYKEQVKQFRERMNFLFEWKDDKGKFLDVPIYELNKAYSASLGLWNIQKCCITAKLFEKSVSLLIDAYKFSDFIMKDKKDGFKNGVKVLMTDLNSKHFKNLDSIQNKEIKGSLNYEKEYEKLQFIAKNCLVIAKKFEKEIYVQRLSNFLELLGALKVDNAAV